MTQPGAETEPSDHPAYSRADILDATAKFTRFTNMMNRLWPGKNSCFVLQAMTALYSSKRQGYELDVSAFAATMDIPRTSAHRMLNSWHRKKYITLERTGRKTLVHLTPSTLERLVTFYEYLLQDGTQNQK